MIDLPHPPRWLRRAPLVRERLRRFAKRHAPRGPVTRTVEGLAWRLAPADNKVDFDIWYKERLDEAAERAFLARHLKAGDVFVDIGANIGLYPVTLLAAIPGLKAVTFEPLERLRRRQLDNLALNGLLERVSIRAEAVGPTGRLTLHESRNAGRSSLLPFEGGEAGPSVEVRPLSELLDEAPAAIKIDVEGFEDKALLPYFEETAADRWPRAVVIETLHRAVWDRDCLQELFQRGYELMEQTDENALIARRSN
ncbi:FkbM family methyltransferase [Acuticoccus sp. M5D2P5]|uniref:FkbM family methyltransferase n=1 Tax=Acuticoccus kalidii TaxID=2910977 RepID=UPI001F002693|nr:FkbM family methyltransferase [Acuticoccus kalidii]MCF3932233.1 FkbM family methyltransferase [Acuticoccus kalidii]